MSLLNSFVLASGNAGLGSLVDTIVSNWLGPVFFILIAITAVVLFWKKQMAAFFTVVIIGIIAALLIFAGPIFFGKDGVFTSAGQNIGKQVKDGGGKTGSIDLVGGTATINL